MMSNTRLQDWDQSLRPEAWAGEIRVNLVRLAAIVLFYGRHLVEWFLAAPDAPIRGRYHLAVTGVVLLWTVLALLLHGWLSRRYFEPWMKYLAIAVDGLMITLLCGLAGGPRTPLVLVYFGLIASSPLRLSIRAVYFATAVAMVGYLVLLGHYAWYQIGFRRYYATPELRIPRSEEIITLLAMLVCGLFAGQSVRQIRRIVATQTSSADSGDYPSTVAEKGQGEP